MICYIFQCDSEFERIVKLQGERIRMFDSRCKQVKIIKRKISNNDFAFVSCEDHTTIVTCINSTFVAIDFINFKADEVQDIFSFKSLSKV